MSKTEKKKWWIYRDWREEELEDALNKMYDEGYLVYQLNLEKRVIVGFLDNTRNPRNLPSSLSPLASLLSSLDADVKVVATGKEADEKEPKNKQEDETEFKHKGANTPRIMTQLYFIMNSHVSGVASSSVTKERVAQAVKQSLGRCSVEEARLSLADFEWLIATHTKHSADHNGKPCGDECTVTHVLNLTIENIKQYLAANPLS